MSTSRESIELTPQVVAGLQAVLEPIAPTRVDQFKGLTSSLAAINEQLAQLVSAKNEAVAPAATEFAYQRNWQSDILQRRRKVEEFIKHPFVNGVSAKGRLNVIRGLKAAKSGEIDTHPYLAPIIEEEGIAKDQYTLAQQQLQETRQNADRRYDPKILIAESSLVETRNRAINLVEEQVLRDPEAPIKYLQVLPQRGKDLSEKYADKWINDYEDIPDLTELEKEVRREYGARKENSPLARFLNANPDIRKIPFKDLPHELRRAFKKRSADRTLAYWKGRLSLTGASSGS